MAQFTHHAAGIHESPRMRARAAGDPSFATAYGTFVGIQTAVRERLGRDSLEGLRVAVQGVGNVGFDLARQLGKRAPGSGSPTFTASRWCGQGNWMPPWSRRRRSSGSTSMCSRPARSAPS